MSPWRRLSALVLVTLSCFGASIPAAPAYHVQAALWPEGVVPYYNAAHDQAWAVARAVAAWNTSGAHVRFVAVPETQAKVVISERANGIYCAEGNASVGYYTSGAYVHIFPGHGITHACNRYWAARMVAHELGHVLGLGHEDRVCAEMNSSGSMRGGAACRPQLLWAWRCRLLEPDDIAGAVAAYGGRARVPAGPALCPLYPAIAPPGNLRAKYDASSNDVTLSFIRPKPPVIPSFVVPYPWATQASYAVATVPSSALDRSCAAAADATTASHFRWHARPGGTERLTTALTLDSGCYAVWAVDELGRPSGRAATVRVQVG